MRRAGRLRLRALDHVCTVGRKINTHLIINIYLLTLLLYTRKRLNDKPKPNSKERDLIPKQTEINKTKKHSTQRTERYKEKCGKDRS